MAEEFEGEVTFIGVSNNDTIEDGMGYRDEFGVPYMLAKAPEVWGLFGDPARPSTIVLDAEGKIFNETIGPVTLEGLRATLEDVTESPAALR